jgi:lipopolysaccharide assembly protein A
MRYVTTALLIVLSLVVLIFAIQNREPVDVAFLMWSMSLRKIYLVLGTYVLGMLSGWGVVEIAKRLLQK